MKVPHCVLLLTVALAPFALSGCNRYAVTLNERTIHTPPTLFTAFKVTDPGLQTCLSQSIKDHNITAPSQLKVLSCTDGDIASVEGIETFSGITTLNLVNNKLTDVSPLLFLGQLKALNLDGNEGLKCAEAKTLAGQLTGQVLLPEHCR